MNPSKSIIRIGLIILWLNLLTNSVLADFGLDEEKSILRGKEYFQDIYSK